MGRLPTNTVLLLFLASSSFLAFCFCLFITQCSASFTLPGSANSLSFFFFFFFEGLSCPPPSSSAVCKLSSLKPQHQDKRSQLSLGRGGNKRQTEGNVSLSESHHLFSSFCSASDFFFSCFVLFLFALDLPSSSRVSVCFTSVLLLTGCTRTRRTHTDFRKQQMKYSFRFVGWDFFKSFWTSLYFWVCGSPLVPAETEQAQPVPRCWTTPTVMNRRLQSSSGTNFPTPDLPHSRLAVVLTTQLHWEQNHSS